MHTFHLCHQDENNYALSVHHPISTPENQGAYNRVGIPKLDEDLFCLQLEEWKHYRHEKKEPDWKRVYIFLSTEELKQLRDTLNNVKVD